MGVALVTKRIVSYYQRRAVFAKASFITKVLEHKAEFACIAMCPLVMSLCSHNLLVMSSIQSNSS